MTTTKSGEKAAKVRGHKRIWMLETRAFLELIEVEPGVAIEDIDTDDFLYRPRVERHYRTIAYASRTYRHEGTQDEPGWFIWEGAEVWGPLSTKAETRRELRGVLADHTDRHWKD